MCHFLAYHRGAARCSYSAQYHHISPWSTHMSNLFRAKIMTNKTESRTIKMRDILLLSIRREHTQKMYNMFFFSFYLMENFRRQRPKNDDFVIIIFDMYVLISSSFFFSEIDFEFSSMLMFGENSF